MKLKGLQTLHNFITEKHEYYVEFKEQYLLAAKLPHIILI
jgi:hypothetical protein